MEKIENYRFSLDVKQAADFMGVKPTTIRKWVQTRRIPFHKVGDLVRFDSAEIQRFWDSTKVEPIGVEAGR